MAAEERYGVKAMTAWVEKREMTRGQALVVGLWLVQARAIGWLTLPSFICKRGKVKTREWYDD
jgi:hypothetical protein